MIYSLIERDTGSVVASYSTEEEALLHVAHEMGEADEWGLFEFGDEPSHTVLRLADHELREAAARSFSPRFRATVHNSAPQITLVDPYEICNAGRAWATITKFVARSKAPKIVQLAAAPTSFTIWIDAPSGNTRFHMIESAANPRQPGADTETATTTRVTQRLAPVAGV